MERMTLKKFDSLKAMNEAVLNEIRGTIKLCEELLHGEGEKDDDFPGPEDIIKMRGKPSPTCDMCDKALPQNYQYCICESCTEILKSALKEPQTELDQPSPTPTRAEWEAWAENELTLHCPYATEIYKANRKAWLLSMPIVPKEQP